MSTFDAIARRVIVEAALSAYGISPEFVLEAWLKSRYKEILDSVSLGNVNRQLTTAFNTVAQYNTGTVTATLGSTAIVGAGTTFSPIMVGRSFRVSNVVPSVYYTVAGFTDANNITLDTAYIGNTVAGAAYTIVQRFYSLLTEIKWITSVLPVGQTQLVENSQEELAISFPDRALSPGTPSIWSAVGWDITTGQRQIELYPPPDILYRILVTGYSNIPAPLLTTAPIVELDERLIASGALEDAHLYRASKQGEIFPVDLNAVRASLEIAKLHGDRFMTLLNNLKRRDATWV